MSHVAMYKISINNFNKRYAYYSRFQKTFEKVMSQILTDFKMTVIENGNAEFLCSSKEAKFSVYFTDKGINIITDSDYLRKIKGEDLKRLVKQGIIASVQLVRYNKYKVQMRGKKLYVEVVA